MHLEHVRARYARVYEGADSYRWLRRRRMTQDTIADARADLVRDILLNGQGLDRIDLQAELPVASDRTITVIVRCLDSLKDDDLTDAEKAVRIGALIRLPWLDLPTLAELKREIPAGLVGLAAIEHGLGDTKTERSKFLCLLDEQEALSVRFAGIPDNAVEDWNLHFLQSGSIFLLVDMGADRAWSAPEKLLGVFDDSPSDETLDWMSANQADPVTLFAHLLEANQCSRVKPARAEVIMKRCGEFSTLPDLIDSWMKKDPSRVPDYMAAWRDEVFHRRTLAEQIDRQVRAADAGSG